jgi:hypothetical protein
MITTEAFNSLVSALFDGETTLAGQYGALCGIRELGIGMEKVIQHLPFYVQLVSNELSHGTFCQACWAARNLRLIEDILVDCVEISENEELCERCRELIRKLPK